MSHKHYPMRIPRTAAGVRLQESRNGIVGEWWAREWQRAMEKMGLKGRLGRGRNYAISGQVTELKMEGPQVRAKVVGTRAEPYSISLDFRIPENAARERIIAFIRSEPILTARLLAGDLPMEVREIFAREGFSLFPGGKLGPGKYDMTSACSCPDYANPCKHTAAVLWILGEEIARRPFSLLELRGILEEELI